MKRITLLGTILGAMVVFAASCGGSSGSSSANSGGHAKGNAPTRRESTTQASSYSPSIDPSDFTTTIDNKYFPLKPGTTFVSRRKTKSTTERDVMGVTHSTKKVMGVKCVVVDDRVLAHAKLSEKTFDWYAQDNKGNVWYFGEDSKEYKKNGKVSTEASWEAGKDGAEPGVIMPANPKVGQTYRQEYLKGVAEDTAKVLDLDGSVTVPYRSFDHAVVTREWSPLEPGVVAHKYYAAGAGDVKEVAVEGPMETLELVDVRSNG
jgi:hypothetical protein